MEAKETSALFEHLTTHHRSFAAVYFLAAAREPVQRGGQVPKPGRRIRAARVLGPSRCAVCLVARSHREIKEHSRRRARRAALCAIDTDLDRNVLAGLLPELARNVDANAGMELTGIEATCSLIRRPSFTVGIGE